jgi:hypothetical protein
MIEVSYEWFIDQMLVKPVELGKQNIVCLVIWRCVGTHDEVTGTQFGTADIKYFESKDFVPYDQITKDMVLSWCWSSGVDKKIIESLIYEEISDKLEPKIIALQNPWT